MLKTNQLIKQPLNNSQIKRVADLVIEHTKTNIFTEAKTQDLVDARALFDYLLKVEYQQTLFAIRDYYISKNKKRHHTTIIHSIKNFKDVVFRNPHFLDIVDVIKLQEVSPRQINNVISLVSKIQTKNQLNKTRKFLKELLSK